MKQMLILLAISQLGVFSIGHAGEDDFICSATCRTGWILSTRTVIVYATMLSTGESMESAFKALFDQCEKEAEKEGNDSSKFALLRTVGVSFGYSRAESDIKEGDELKIPADPINSCKANILVR